jgi:RNAse (barnase) inhibitor barstar
VAAFDRTELEGDRAWRLSASSFVSLFWQRSILEETTRWLLDHGYYIVSLDCSEWSDEADLHRGIATALDFPSYYGRNLDALNDCLSDVVAYSYGTRADATGTTLVLQHYDAFAAKQRDVAQAVLDIFAKRARTASLVGHRMLCLVQSDDPQIRFEPVGSTSILWNPEEWLDAKRDPSGTSADPI